MFCNLFICFYLYYFLSPVSLGLVLSLRSEVESASVVLSVASGSLTAEALMVVGEPPGGGAVPEALIHRAELPLFSTASAVCLIFSLT